MTSPTPRDSAQLPPHFLQSGVFSGEHHKWVIDYAERYAREALRAQAASVEPYGQVTANKHTGQYFFYRWPQPPYLDNSSECITVYAGAPPAHIPADVEAMAIATEALEEIALAGMSGTGQESDEAMTEWHARQAWKFIGIAARAKSAIAARAGQVAAPAMVPVSDSGIDDLAEALLEVTTSEVVSPESARAFARAVESISAKLNGLTVGDRQASGRVD